MATRVAPQNSEEAAIHEAIERRARELWEQRGRQDGHAEEDWRQAEQEILSELGTVHLSPMRRIMVKAAGVVYTGEYDPAIYDSYRPGELQPGAEIRIQFNEDRMRLKLAGGKELEARIVNRASER